MIGTKQLRGRRKGLIVQTRDRELLWQLSLMRMADRDQLMTAAGFHSITRINARLLALYRAGLLRRFFVGFGAGRKAIYALSPKGALLIGVPCRGPRRRQNELLAADFSTLHQLAVNDVYCNLRFGPKPPHVRFVNFAPLTEPVDHDRHLIPDGYVELKTPSDLDCAFLEIDLGTEELNVWKEKARQYLRFAASGEFTLKFHQPRFRVLVLANSARRIKFIRAAVAEITQKICWFAVLDETRGDRFFDSVWLRPTGDNHQPLFEQPR